MLRQCIVRDLDGINDTTSPMSCIKAMELAKSGKWYKNWSIDEVTHNSEGSAPILHPRIQFKDGEYSFMTQERFFILI